MFWKLIGRKIFYPLAVLCALSLWLLATDSGLKTSFTFIKWLMPGTLTTLQITGSWINGIQLEGLSYESKGIKFTAKTAELEPQVFQLFNQRIQIPYFRATDSLLEIKYHSAKPIYISKIEGNLNATNNFNQFSLEILNINGSWLDLPLNGRAKIKIDNQRLFPLNLMLSLGENHLKISPSTEHKDQMNWIVSLNAKNSFQAVIDGVLSSKENYSEWQGEITNAFLTSSLNGDWILKAPAQFNLNAQNFYVKELKFENHTGVLATAFANWDQQEGLLAVLEIPLLPIQHPKLKGKASTIVTIYQKPNEPLYAKGDFNLFPGVFTLITPENKERKLAFQGGKATVQLDNGVLWTQFDFNENDHNHITGKFYLPVTQPFAAILDQPLQGSLTGTFGDINFLYVFFPQISKLKANLDITGNIIGTLKNPILQLLALSKNASFLIPKQAVYIKNINAEISGEIPGALTLIASGTSGNGQFKLNGIYEHKNGPDFSCELLGKNIQIYNTNSIKIAASPQLAIHYHLNTLYIEGEVPILEANIILKDEKNSIAVSRDVVIINPSINDTISTLKVVPSLYVTTENRLHFKGYGLDAIIGGKLAIDKRPDGLLSGTGRLTIKEGKYRLQGATRYINRGYLLFPSGTLLNDPILDIRIVQKNSMQETNASDVGIYVQGTLQKPILYPYSNANLQSTEILSRLGFGSTSTAESETERQLLSQTAFLIAGSANPVIEHLQENFGLEEFNIETRETHKSLTTQGATDTVLVLGKSLSRKLYLQYLQSVLEPISTVRLKYALTPSFSASVETGTEGMGGDLIYSVEKD